MYKRFASFLTAYLNQDWDLDYSSDTDAAGAAAGNPSVQYIQIVVENANEIITSFPVSGMPSQ